MRRWVYVICEMIDEQPSFRHAFVMAETEEGAYTMGHATVKQPDGNGINDYVIDLGDIG